MNQPVVLVSVQGSVQIITINRPAVRNAINKEVAVALAAALIELDARPELHVGIQIGRASCRERV